MTTAAPRQRPATFNPTFGVPGKELVVPAPGSDGDPHRDRAGGPGSRAACRAPTDATPGAAIARWPSAATKVTIPEPRDPARTVLNCLITDTDGDRR